ncbi:MAG: hypothetical protein GXO39_00925 [Thermotogae bacterium]|nr:hypothetical protein [Thermotogota bacterium]
MSLGEVREFDFSPFYARINGGKIPVPLSGVETLIMSGRIDATPYPCTLASAIPKGYGLLPYGVSLGAGAESLYLLSRMPLGEISSLGVLKGYEFLLHLLEEVLEITLKQSLKTIRLGIVSDVFPNHDAYILYGDKALRRKEYGFPVALNLAKRFYELKGRPLNLAVWIARLDLREEAEVRIGNSLAFWMLNRKTFTRRYAEERKIPFAILKSHVSHLIFGPMNL